MSERTGVTHGMADVEIRTVESLDEPDRYAGWTVISFGDDGSVLIQSKTGARERVKVVGTVEMQDTIRELEAENAKLRSLVARHADPDGKTPSAIHAAMMVMEIALDKEQRS